MCTRCFKPLAFTSSRRSLLLGAGVAAGTAAFGRVLGGTPARAQAAPPRFADVLFTDARVVTLDPRRPTAEAVAVAGDTIIGVGTRRELEPLRGEGTRVIDAGGRSLVPGLNDSHAHFIRGGLTYSQELRWDAVPSLADALRMLADQARRTPAPNWVAVMGGWTPGQFAEKRFPTLDEINAATGDVPAYVMHIYDRAFLNRAALRVLGFTRDTPDPFGGRLERDANGAPTGVVVNVANIGSLLGIFARIPKLSADDQITSTRHFMRELNRLGVTSVIDAGGGGQNYPDNYAAVQKLADDGQLTLRIGYTLFAQRPGKEVDDYARWVTQVRAGEGTDYFRMAGAGEYMVWAMHDPANFAKDVVPPGPGAEDQMVEALKIVAKNGWPFRLHANYDATAANLMTAIERAHREVPVDGLRWAIDHGETLQPATLERIAKLGGSVAIQNRMTLDGDAFAARWGAAAAADAPPVGRMREMGLHLAGGTDGNRASSHNPWVGIQWMVTGRTVAGTKLNADRNLVDRTEALRLYSAAGAWMTREEGKKGTIEPGKWADLALLSEDYMGVPDARISDITALLTMVGGKVVHGSGAYASLAPPPLKVTPDWLPIGTYGGYHYAAGDTRVFDALARSASAAFVPEVGADGTPMTPCSCGLL